MIDRAAAALAEASDDLLVVANAAGAKAWLPGVRTVCDVRPGLGALGGVQTALHHTTSDVVVLAWDAPFVPGALLRALRDAGERAGTEGASSEGASSEGAGSEGAGSEGVGSEGVGIAGEGIKGVDAVVPVSTGPWGFEPLVAWYSRACLGVIEHRLDAGDARAGAWLDDVRVHRLDAARWGVSELLFYNVNTPGDLARAELLANGVNLRKNG